MKSANRARGKEYFRLVGPGGMGGWRSVLGPCSVVCTDGLIVFKKAGASGVLGAQDRVGVGEKEMAELAAVTEAAGVIVA